MDNYFRNGKYQNPEDPLVLSIATWIIPFVSSLCPISVKESVKVSNSRVSFVRHSSSIVAPPFG